MKQRAPYRDEVFDNEVYSFYGTISAVDTLSGATLRFVGWDANGAVVWDTAAPTSIPAAVQVTDAGGKKYSVQVGPLPADQTTSPPTNKVYSWAVQRTNAGQGAALVWGFVTVTPTNPANNC